MSVQNWEHFFKPENRNSGRAFVVKGKVSLSQPSDTEIQAYVRASTSFKVSFKCRSVESPVVVVDCTCPSAKKGQLCKHIWAVLLVIEDKKPDFLESKTDLQKDSVDGVESTPKTKASLARQESQAAQKLKQAEYRKDQYQKQKQRLKDQKLQKKMSLGPDEYPLPVEAALKYFSENGFELRDSMTKVAVGAAVKKLARIFHPDVGGSHSEILELNRNADILNKFSKS